MRGWSPEVEEIGLEEEPCWTQTTGLAKDETGLARAAVCELRGPGCMIGTSAKELIAAEAGLREGGSTKVHVAAMGDRDKGAGTELRLPDAVAQRGDKSAEEIPVVMGVDPGEGSKPILVD